MKKTETLKQMLQEKLRNEGMVKKTFLFDLEDFWKKLKKLFKRKEK
jgi:hypothetical protein